MENSSRDFEGVIEKILSIKYGGIRRLHRIFLVVNRGSGTGEIIDLVDLGPEWLGDVMEYKSESRILLEIVDIRFISGEEVVETDDFISFIKESSTEMTSDKSGSAGDENFYHSVVKDRF